MVHAIVASRCAGCSAIAAATATASTAAAINRNDHIRVFGWLAEGSEIGDLASGRVLVLRRSSSAAFWSSHFAWLYC